MELHRKADVRGTRTFFASANSYIGFYSLYDEIFNESDYKYVYILKGGPGTGKSTCIGMIAAEAEARGYDTETFLCSSDPGSYDGVIISDIGVAVIDGTAPHGREPQIPGACGQIVNLGESWSMERLSCERDNVERLFTEKSNCYSRAYGLLKSACGLWDDEESVARRAVLRDKMRSAAERMFCKLIPHDDGDGIIKRRFTRALTGQGDVSYTYIFDDADIKIAVCGNEYASQMYLGFIAEEGRRHGSDMLIIPDHLMPSRINTVYFPRCGAAFSIRNTPDGSDLCVNMRRFIDNDIIAANRTKLRFAEKIRRLLTDEALMSLSLAGKVHSEIEKIYKSAMDFDAVRASRERLCEKIFG